MARALTTIGFDADDTLWQNEHFYGLTKSRFATALAGYAEPDALSAAPARRPSGATSATTASASRASPCR